MVKAVAHSYEFNLEALNLGNRAEPGVGNRMEIGWLRMNGFK